MLLRRLNDKGMTEFENYLIALKDSPRETPPFSLLSDPECSEEVVPAIDIKEQTFASRYDAAAYLSSVFNDLELSLDVLRDTGLWTWLTLFYLDQVLPLTSAGIRKPNELAVYIPNIRNFQHYYRHSLVGPYRVYRAHRDAPERTLALLCNPLHQSGEVFEQTASVQGILTAPGAIEAVTKLYYNPETGGLKPGAGGKKAGSARRLREFLNQIDLTWDLYSIQADQLVELLPQEFGRFRR